MALHIACPSCRTEAVVDQAVAGRQVLCPRCGHRFTAPSITAEEPSHAPASVLPSDDPTEEMDALPRFDERSEFGAPLIRDLAGPWRGTVVGLSIMFWTIIAMMVLTVPFLGMGIVAEQLKKQAPAQPPGAEQAVLGLGMLGMLCLLIVASITYFVGMCLCCGVPRESGAKGRAISAVVLTVVFFVAVFLTVIFIFLRALQMQRLAPGQSPISPEAAVVITVGAAAFGVAILITWMLFHRAVALYFSNRALARNVLWYMGVYVALVAANALLTVITSTTPGADSGGVVCFGLLSHTALFIWFMVILRRTRNTIVEGVASMDVTERDDNY